MATAPARKANRRDPDDYNKPGRITSVEYMPDLHVYVDTSGSISEANYQEAVLLLIRIAKKLNVNLYFNSFSHILSQQTLLKHMNTPGKDPAEFRRDLDKPTRALLIKAIERDPKDRFQTPAELRDALLALPKQDW